jgi:hypothetical protein
MFAPFNLNMTDEHDQLEDEDDDAITLEVDDSYLGAD